MNFENNEKSQKLSDKNLNQSTMNKNYDDIYENKSCDNKSEVNIDDCSLQRPKTFNVNNNRININSNIPIDNILKEYYSNSVSYLPIECSNNNNINNLNNNSYSKILIIFQRKIQLIQIILITRIIQ